MSGKHSSDSKQTRKIKKKELENRTSNKSKIIFIIIAIAFIAITVMFYISIMKTNMLPNSYITIFTIGESIITLLLLIGLVKKHKTLKLNIFCTIIIIIISTVYILGNHYLNATMDFLGETFVEVAEVEEYYVVVEKNSEYSKIEDINHKRIYGFQVEDDVKQKIQNKVNVTISSSDNLTELGNSLLNKEVEVIVVSSSQYNILSEEIDGFRDNTKIIDTETHEIETQVAIKDVNTEYNIQNGIFNVYISGIDTYGNINNVSRSDANILATVNTNTYEVLLISIPRDYYVTLRSKKAKDKLTHAGIYGINETVATVEDLLGVDINYYVRVNFTTVIKLVDTLGGIDVYSEYQFYKDGYSFKKGYNRLNGSAALVFSRERNSFRDGDNQRIKNQQAVMEAIINKTLSSKTILTKYTSILNSLSGSFNTNIDQNEVSDIVKEQLENMPSWKITTLTLTGTGATKTTYSLGNKLSYVMVPDESSINEAKNEIKSMMGE